MTAATPILLTVGGIAFLAALHALDQVAKLQKQIADLHAWRLVHLHDQAEVDMTQNRMIRLIGASVVELQHKKEVARSV